jgi:aspartate/methionine/tyrosine aminotransferase
MDNPVNYVLAELRRSRVTYNLAFGAPTHPVPDELKMAACQAIKENFNSYAPPAGHHELRHWLQTISERETLTPLPLPLICNGVGAGLAATFFSLLKPNDEVLIPDPYFAQHKELIDLVGAKAVPLSAYNTFHLPLDALTDALTKKTRAIVINSPNNPTGVIYSSSEIDDLIAFAERHHLFVISDEIYRDVVFPGSPLIPAPSPLGRYTNVVCIRGISKSLGAAGWRLGFVFAPEPLLQQIIHFHTILYMGAPSPFQIALARTKTLVNARISSDLCCSRDIALQLLGQRFAITPPGGGYFLFPGLPPGIRGMDFFRLALAADVSIMPGLMFSENDTHFRLSLAVPADALASACRILLSLAT